MIGLWKEIYELHKALSDFSIRAIIRNILEHLSVANPRMRTSRSSKKATSCHYSNWAMWPCVVKRLRKQHFLKEES